MEMLVYTEPGKIELLPAWPKEYADGRLKGIRVFGGHTLDLAWKAGKLTEAVLHAAQDGAYEVVYLGKTRQLDLKNGEVYSLLDVF